MTRSSKPRANHDALSESPVFGDLTDEFEQDDDFDQDDRGRDSSPGPADESWEDLASAFDDDSEDYSDEDSDESVDQPSPRASRTSRRRGRESTRGRSSRPSGTGLPIGTILIAVGAVWGIASLVAEGPLAGVNATLAGLGLSPGLCLVAGLVLRTLALGRSQAEGQTDRIGEEFESIAAQLEALGAPQEGGDLIAQQLDRVLLAAERQLEKIQNLTRATKMYGKPLVDISKQVSELSTQLGDVSKLPEMLAAMLREQQATPTVDEALHDQVRELGRIARGTQSGLREVHEQLGEALAKRIESIAAQVAAVSVELSNQPEQSSPDEELAQIRREMQAVTTGLSQLSTKIAQIPSRISAVAPSGHAAAASPQSASNDAGGGEDQDPAGQNPAAGALAQKIAGSRPAGSKGVMSAIEKLKSMRN